MSETIQSIVYAWIPEILTILQAEGWNLGAYADAKKAILGALAKAMDNYAQGIPASFEKDGLTAYLMLIKEIEKAQNIPPNLRVIPLEIWPD